MNKIKCLALNRISQMKKMQIYLEIILICMKMSLSMLSKQNTFFSGIKVPNLNEKNSSFISTQIKEERNKYNNIAVYLME